MKNKEYKTEDSTDKNKKIKVNWNDLIYPINKKKKTKGVIKKVKRGIN